VALLTFESAAFGLIDPDLWKHPYIKVSAVGPNRWGAYRRHNYAVSVNRKIWQKQA
jgi:hypothetical protein